MLAVSHVGYIAAGWGIVLGSLALYGLRTVRRGRTLAQQVPPEDRRWT
ncbi:MAG: hypothetical protein Q8K58_04850 [Acidimicrobiales bacterium]|nr:hypothetical protein [Acidimicrobiales bacterium]